MSLLLCTSIALGTGEWFEQLFSVSNRAGSQHLVVPTSPSYLDLTFALAFVYV